jgi:hypothetical protein
MIAWFMRWVERRRRARLKRRYLDRAEPVRKSVDRREERRRRLRRLLVSNIEYLPPRE